jgi:diadenylate cyclase
MEDREKKMFDFLKKVSPGSSLRIVIDDLIRSNLGALIALDSPKIQDCFEGGFRVNCRFTPQRLFELCKMDGAVIVSSDLKRILYGNVLLTPDKAVSTNETGTRHKAAEKTAKQAETFIIAVSERRKKTTVYYCKNKTYLRQVEEILRGLTNSLYILEKQKEQFSDLLTKLNILEISELVSVGDICKILQRCEMISRISDSMRRELIELGKEGNIVHMRFRELTKGVEKKGDEMIRDYSPLSLKKTKLLLSNLTFDSLTEPEAIGRLIFQKDLEDSISPKGIRFLAHIGLSDKESSSIIHSFANLNEILEAEEIKLEGILKGRASILKKEITNLREQILEGKVYF